MKLYRKIGSANFDAGHPVGAGTDAYPQSGWAPHHADGSPESTAERDLRATLGIDEECAVGLIYQPSFARGLAWSAAFSVPLWIGIIYFIRWCIGLWQ